MIPVTLDIAIWWRGGDTAAFDAVRGATLVLRRYLIVYHVARRVRCNINMHYQR